FYEIRKKLLSNCSTNQRYDTLARSRKYNRCSSRKSKFTIKYPTAYIRPSWYDKEQPLYVEAITILEKSYGREDIRRMKEPSLLNKRLLDKKAM
nr:hypothetical protein [Tanacetum cinerariifolium]